MTWYAVIVKDADVAQREEIKRNVEFNVGLQGEAKRYRITKDVAARFKNKQAAGTLYSVAEVECPDGGANCRNCGDPDYEDACRAAGHCPACGTKHGIAPTRHVDEHGYEIVQVDGPPKDGQVWDNSQRKFV